MAFPRDQRLTRKGATYRVIRWLNSFDVQLENVLTGELSICKSHALLQEYADGDLTPVEGDASRRHLPPRLHDLDAQERALDHSETHRRLKYVRAIKEELGEHPSRAAVMGCIARTASQLGDRRPPSVATAHRWRRLYLASRQGVEALISRVERRGGRGQARLDPRVEAIIAQQAEAILDTQHRWDAQDLYRAVALSVNACNVRLPKSAQLAPPSLRTIQRRLQKLFAYDVAEARYGAAEAERRFAALGRARSVRRILEMVEVDHTPLDILVVNEAGVAAARPSFTVVLDRRSRCVLGFHLSAAGHGTQAVFAALRHALLPKTYLQTRYAHLELSWPCHGWFGTLLMDNGTEFHARAVADALHQLGIASEYCESRRPNDKPYVERFLRTLNLGFIHKLPGATFSRYQDRAGIKPEREACLTLDELDERIHQWICGVYHLKKHRGLNGRYPIDVWNDEARGTPPILKLGATEIDIEFGEVEEKSIWHYGIETHRCRYNSAALTDLRRRLPVKAKVVIKWSRSDIGHIHVWNPIDGEYLKVPNLDSEMTGVTQDQAIAARRLLTEENETYRAHAVKVTDAVREEIRRKASDKKLKVRKQAERLANRTSEESRKTMQAPIKASLSSTTATQAHEDVHVPVVHLPEARG